MYASLLEKINLNFSRTAIANMLGYFISQRPDNHISKQLAKNPIMIYLPLNIWSLLTCATVCSQNMQLV